MAGHDVQGVHPVATHLHPPQHEGMNEHFEPTDPRIDIARHPVIDRVLRSRMFQFFLILPNQIIFWVVMATGILGAALPTRNFASVITWYIWFCVVFLLMVGVGRGWCVMCPFGGLAEWVQRLSFWKRRPVSLSVGWKWPKQLARWGLLPSVWVFIALTWFEEYFNIAAPGVPAYTSYLVVFIIAFALLTFLLFERRTFCRYLCPLTALIGSVGATGGVAGFRTRDRNRCLTCPTKDCMRGSEDGYGCPWYEWPGSASSNLTCGLCAECYKNCPYDNIGLYVQPPLTSVVATVNRRVDVAWGILLLLGLVLFQQLNALPIYSTVDAWLNRVTQFPGYPNPIDYLIIIVAVALVVAGAIWALVKAFSPSPTSVALTPTARAGKGLTAFAGLAYTVAPVMASDYLARQLPKFWDHALRIVPAISNPLGLGWNLFGTAHSSLYNVHLLSNSGVVTSQLIVVGIGTLASLYSALKVVGRDFDGRGGRLGLLYMVWAVGLVAIGVSMMVLYVFMNGAQ